jgi:uncharacterized membrane protein
MFIVSIFIVIVIGLAMHALPVTIFILVGTTVYFRLRILIGMTNGKLLMGSRPAAPKRLWMFGLFGVIFGRRRIMILEIQGI